MKLTITERAILANQNKILAFLDQDNAPYYNRKTEIFEEGFEGLYVECFTQISEGVSDEICKETHDILHMYRVINNLISSLTDEQKETLEIDKIKFEGFDQNNDKHYGFMAYLIEKDGCYKELIGQYLNSHNIISISKYRLMLPVYKAAVKSFKQELDLDGLRNLISLF